MKSRLFTGLFILIATGLFLTACQSAPEERPTLRTDRFTYYYSRDSITDFVRQGLKETRGVPALINHDFNRDSECWECDSSGFSCFLAGGAMLFTAESESGGAIIPGESINVNDFVLEMSFEYPNGAPDWNLMYRLDSDFYALVFRDKDEKFRFSAGKDVSWDSIYTDNRMYVDPDGKNTLILAVRRNKMALIINNQAYIMVKDRESSKEAGWFNIGMGTGQAGKILQINSIQISEWN